MLAILKQPYPAQTLSGVIRMAAGIGLFVAVFLLVFQPFGMREAPDSVAKTLAILGYGLVTFGCISVSAFVLSGLFPGWFLFKSWTVGKEISITLFNFLLIGLCNTLYTFLVFGQPFSLSYLLYFQFVTLVVGVLPVSLIVLWRHNRLLRQSILLAQEMNSEIRKTAARPENFHNSDVSETTENIAGRNYTFSSESGTDSVSLNQHNFLFATAADNYVEIHLSENSQPRKNLIRNTLTRLEETLKTDSKMVRCHRAYLVNLNQVCNFSGNAQGLKLELNGTPELIPVSRKMVPAIKAMLHG